MRKGEKKVTEEQQQVVEITPENSFTFGGVVIAARPLMIVDQEEIQNMVGKMPEDLNPTSAYRFLEFMVAGTIVSGQLPLARVSSSATPEEIANSYSQWRRLHRSLLDSWAMLIARVDVPPNEYGSVS